MFYSPAFFQKDKTVPSWLGANGNKKTSSSLPTASHINGKAKDVVSKPVASTLENGKQELVVVKKEVVVKSDTTKNPPPHDVQKRKDVNIQKPKDKELSEVNSKTENKASHHKQPVEKKDNMVKDKENIDKTKDKISSGDKQIVHKKIEDPQKKENIQIDTNSTNPEFAYAELANHKKRRKNDIEMLLSQNDGDASMEVTNIRYKKHPAF